MASALTLATTPSMPTERVGAGVHPIRQCRGVTYVDRGADRGGAVGGQRRLRRGDRVRGTGAVRDGGALGKQSLDDGAADPARAAGDQEALARQSEIHVSSSVFQYEMVPSDLAALRSSPWMPP